MEEAIYYATIAAVIAFGLLAATVGPLDGPSRVDRPGRTMIALVMFLCLIIGLAIFSPDSLVSRGNRRPAGRAAALRLGARGGFGDRRPASRRESHRPGCFNGRNALLPESRPAT